MSVRVDESLIFISKLGYTAVSLQLFGEILYFRVQSKGGQPGCKVYIMSVSITSYELPGIASYTNAAGFERGVLALATYEQSTGVKSSMNSDDPSYGLPKSN